MIKLMKMKVLLASGLMVWLFFWLQWIPERCSHMIPMEIRNHWVWLLSKPNQEAQLEQDYFTAFSPNILNNISVSRMGMEDICRVMDSLDNHLTAQMESPIVRLVSACSYSNNSISWNVLEIGHCYKNLFYRGDWYLRKRFISKSPSSGRLQEIWQKHEHAFLSFTNWVQISICK